MNGKLIVAAFFAICSACAQNIGMGLQKIAHKKLEKLNFINQQRDPNSKPRPYYKYNPWWVATSLFIAGVITDFIVLAILPTSVALPIAGFGLISSAWFAKRYLGEILSKKDMIGIALIIAGALTTVIFSADPQPPRYPVELWSNMLNFTHLSGIYCLIALITVFSIYYYSKKITFLFVFVPGLIGIFGNIFGKGAGEIAFRISEQTRLLFRFTTIVWYIWTVFVLIKQNDALQKAIAQFDTVLVSPIYYVTLCFAAFFNAAFYFGEFANIGFLQFLGILSGFACVVVGTYFISINHIYSSKQHEQV